MAEIPGRLGRFEIRRLLGAGRFGVVYLAYDPVLDREVALKVLRTAALEQPEVRARFLREAKAAAQLRHPHIVPVYDAGSDAEQHYIASAYIEGRTLADLIGDEPPDFRRAAGVIRDLAGALDYAHRVGVIHRDIKPANIMIDGRGEPHLTDFGLARIEGSEEKLTQDGSLMGTPAYMAPEQADRGMGEVGPASDQYGLGVILYELLCGRPPFSGPAPALIYSAVHQPPDPPRSLNPQVPRDLETICLKAVAKGPQDRYADCGQLAEDLRLWLADEPIRARRMGPAERLLHWCRRNPLMATLLAAVVVVTLLGLAGVTWQWRRAEGNLELAVQERVRAERLVGQLEEEIGQKQNALTAAERERKRAEDLAREREEALRRAKQHLEDAEREREKAVNAQGAERLARDDAEKARGEAESALAKEIAARSLAEERALIVRRQLYSIHAKDAMEAFRAKRYERVRELLGQYVPGPGEQDLRGFGGHYLWRSLATVMPRDRLPNRAPLESVALSPDGRTIATWGGGKVTLWDIGTGKERLAVDAPGGSRLRSLGVFMAGLFSPDGRIFVSQRGTYIELWEVATGKQLHTLKGHKSGVWGVGFSPDGAILASAGGPDGTVRLWDVATGELRGELEEGPNHRTPGLTGAGLWVQHVVFSPDGKTLASMNNVGEAFSGNVPRVTLWDVAARKKLDVIRGGSWLRPFSPDGRLLARSDGRGTVALRDVRAGKELGALAGHTGVVSSVAFSPDGATLAVSSSSVAHSREGTTLASKTGGTIKLWDLATLQWRADIKTPPGSTGSMSFSPDGKTLVAENLQQVPAAGGKGRQAADAAVGFSFTVWDVATGNEQLLPRVEDVRFAGFMRDGNILGLGIAGTELYLRQFAVGKEQSTLIEHKDAVESVAVSPDGKTLASGGRDQIIRLRELSTGRVRPPLSGHTDWVTEIAFLPDSNGLVSAGRDKLVILWDLEKGRHQLLGTHNGVVHSVAVSPDGNALASASDDKSTMLFDLRTRLSVRLNAHTAGVHCLAFSPLDGQTLASGDAEGRIILWDLRSREPGAAPKPCATLQGHSAEVLCLRFSPDGKTLASAGKDGAIKLWDVADPQKPPREQATLRGHTGAVRSIAFSPEGGTLASGSDDKTIKLWNVPLGLEEMTLSGHTDPVRSLAFSPDGMLLISGSSGGAIRLWRSR